MIKTPTVLGLIFCLAAALLGGSEYLIMNKLVCPPEMRECASKSCDKPADVCRAQAPEPETQSCCAEPAPEPESPCQASCGAEQEEPAETSPPCPKSNIPSKCCFVVHPFVSEAPAKLALVHIDSSALLPEPREPIFVATYTAFPITRIPPWGVHPSISTTVLRI